MKALYSCNLSSSNMRDGQLKHILVLSNQDDRRIYLLPDEDHGARVRLPLT